MPIAQCLCAGTRCGRLWCEAVRRVQPKTTTARTVHAKPCEPQNLCCAGSPCAMPGASARSARGLAQSQCHTCAASVSQRRQATCIWHRWGRSGLVGADSHSFASDLRERAWPAQSQGIIQPSWCLWAPANARSGWRGDATWIAGIMGTCMCAHASASAASSPLGTSGWLSNGVSAAGPTTTTGTCATTLVVHSRFQSAPCLQLSPQQRTPSPIGSDVSATG